MTCSLSYRWSVLAFGLIFSFAMLGNGSSARADTPPTVTIGGPSSLPPVGDNGGQTSATYFVESYTDPTFDDQYCTIQSRSFTFSASVSPSGALVTIDANTGQLTFQGFSAGTYTITVTVTGTWQTDNCGTQTATDSMTTTATVIAVSISADGQYVGCGLDQAPINLTANPTPSNLTGASYAWTVAAGPGSGTFGSPSQQNTTFVGSMEGDATLQVTLTYQSATTYNTTPVGIVRIDNLTDAPIQVVDQPDVDLDAPYTISNDGTLLSVLISPVEDDENPYVWNEDYTGWVDHQTGDVILMFSSPGPYLLQVNRQNAGGGTTSSYIEVEAGGVGLSGGKGKPVGRVQALPVAANPSPAVGDLILISSANPPADLTGFDVVSRAKLRQVVPPPNAARNVVYVGTVNQAITAINNKFAANGGQLFNLVCIGHGAPAQFDMGGGVTFPVGSSLLGAEMGNAASSTRAFAAACNGQVNSCYLFGCQVALGAAGSAFLKGLADNGNMAGGVSGWNVVVYSWPVGSLPARLVGSTWGVTRGGVLTTRRPGPGG